MEEKRNITQDTKIVFTIKSFFALMGSMLGLFFGFYMLVVAPAIEDNGEKLDRVNEQLLQLHNGIGTLNGTVSGINDRFDDLRDLRNNTKENISGNFSSDN